MLEKHNEEVHPVRTVHQCNICNASYYEKEMYQHSCISYIMQLLKTIVGTGTFEKAVKKVNEKYDDDKSTGEIIETDKGTLETYILNKI